MFHEILKRLVREGYEVDAVATDNTGDMKVVDGVRVFRGKKYADMLGHKYDLVITQFGQAFKIAPEAKRLNIPCVYIVHNNMNPTTDFFASNSPELVVFNSQWIKDDYKYKKPSVIVHPPVYAKDHATERGERITLVNLIPSKGAHVFYNMASAFPGQKFLGVIGGYYKNQQVVIPRQNVKIIDTTESMKEGVWQKTKILLMPSEYESYGMVGVEALASGIPVIANPTPGLKESLGYAGIFPENNTIGAWKKAIAHTLQPKNYEAASQLALQRSSEINPEHELDVLVRKIGKLI